MERPKAAVILTVVEHTPCEMIGGFQSRQELAFLLFSFSTELQCVLIQLLHIDSKLIFLENGFSGIYGFVVGKKCDDLKLNSNTDDILVKSWHT